MRWIIAVCLVLVLSGCDGHILTTLSGKRDRVCFKDVPSDQLPLAQVAVKLAYRAWQIPEQPVFVDGFCNVEITFLGRLIDDGEQVVVGRYYPNLWLWTPLLEVSLVAGNPFETLVHEIGHWMGLRYGSGAIHNPNPFSIMHGKYFDGQLLLPEDIYRMGMARN